MGASFGSSRPCRQTMETRAHRRPSVRNASGLTASLFEGLWCRSRGSSSVAHVCELTLIVGDRALHMRMGSGGKGTLSRY